MKRNERSELESELLEMTERLLPSGVRNATMNPDYAMVVARAQGSHITDLSGNEYIDYLLGSGPMFLGHANPAVVAAVREQLEHGSNYLMVSEPVIRLAQVIVDSVPCAERVLFHSSGSESTFFAMRLARAHRKRSLILKFEGGFHGMSDYALMSNQWTPGLVDHPTPVPNSAGIPASISDEVIIAPFNDVDRTRDLIEQHADSLAGVIVEPMQRTIPPKPGFLEALREVTQRLEIPLIFDEVVTGFRLAFGGAQEYYGVVPDLCALGKSISGGHPIGVLCGRAEILALADPGRRLQGDYVMQTGTFSGNPISATAALACISELKKPGCYERLERIGRRLMGELQRMFDDAGMAVCVTGEPSAFQPWFTEIPVVDFRSSRNADWRLGARFVDLLIQRGVIKAHEKFFVSMAHTDEDVERTLEAFAGTVERMKAEAR